MTIATAIPASREPGLNSTPNAFGNAYCAYDSRRTVPSSCEMSTASSCGGVYGHAGTHARHSWHRFAR